MASWGPPGQIKWPSVKARKFAMMAWSGSGRLQNGGGMSGSDPEVPANEAKAEGGSGEGPRESPLALPASAGWPRKLFFGRGGLRAGWRLLVYVALTFILGHFLLRALHLKPGQAAAFTISAALPGEVLGVVAVLAAALVMGKFEKRSLADYGLPWRKALRARFWEGALWGFLELTAVLAVLRGAGAFSLNGLALHGREAFLYAAGWGVFFLAVGIFEEFPFRGYAQFTLTTGMRMTRSRIAWCASLLRPGFWPAAVLLSLAFGLAHFDNPGENWLGALDVVVSGLAFSMALRRTGDLWFAIGLHAAWDWGETFFYGVPDSGMVGVGHFLNSSLQGPKWLSGGNAGPEGSIVGLAFDVATVALIAWRFPEVRYPAPGQLRASESASARAPESERSPKV